MTENDKLAPAGEVSGGLTKRIKIGGSPLHQRLAQQPLPKKVETATVPQAQGPSPIDLASTLDNRLGVMLDVSSSMGSPEEYRRGGNKRKIDHLKEAMQSFFQNCDFSNTSVAIETFPPEDEEEDDEEDMYRSHSQDVPDDPLADLLPKAPKPRLKAKRNRYLTNIHALLAARVDELAPHGCTPMAECLEETLGRYPVTRGILVSDGEADSSPDAISIAHSWKAADTVIDCVHIGRSSGGEATLKEIARITGGMYIKFDNVENFAKNFKFLTPANRYLLVAGGANLIGAKEVKR